ncbi:MAG: PAS domain S-box protein [Candidatus Helarchaeota archaeon]
MSKSIRVLIIEDSEDDTLLLLRTLQRNGYNPIYQRVETKEALKDALANNVWDIILSDYLMPKLSGLDALTILKESGLDLPFILVSGAVGEETAVQLMKAGAHDYINKDNLTRLIPAIEREILEAKIRHQRRIAEQNLKKSEERYRNLINNLSDLIIEADLNGNSTYLSPQLYKMFGVLPEELIGKSIITWIHPDDKQKALDAMKNALNSDEPEIFEIRIRHKDGHYVFVSINGRLIKSDDGAKYLAVIRDITAQKRAERNLRESEEKYRLITENANDIIIVIDYNYKVEYINEKAYSNLMGYSKVNLIGQKITDLLPEITLSENQSQMLNFVEKIFIKGEDTREIQLLRKDGATIWVEFKGHIFIDKNGNQKGLIISRDITERKALEEARKNYMQDLEKEVAEKTRKLKKETKELQITLAKLKASQERLIQSEKLASIGLLAAGIAHEINNPIMGIINYAEILRKEIGENHLIDLNSKPYSFINSIIKEAERISAIVEDLLTFARKDLGKYIYEDINTVIKSSLSLLYSKITSSQIKIQLNFHEKLPKIPMKPQNIQQVILNIIQNSIAALDEKFGIYTTGNIKKILIQTFLITRKNKKFVKISITDNGQGIKKKNLQKIFDPFFTTKSHTKEQGIGLGLSISYRIIKDHGGEIQIRSKWKKFTTVNILLPIKHNSSEKKHV